MTADTAELLRTLYVPLLAAGFLCLIMAAGSVLTIWRAGR